MQERWQSFKNRYGSALEWAFIAVPPSIVAGAYFISSPRLEAVMGFFAGWLIASFICVCASDRRYYPLNRISGPALILVWFVFVPLMLVAALVSWRFGARDGFSTADKGA